ncbi:hypothetical protein ACLMJK_001404 [Lecanora helva]
MQPIPRTPNKADDGIEKVKQSLSTTWGIRLPSHDSLWSPSRRDPYCAEDKISSLIQLLYFKPYALDEALRNFERNAATIHTKWQYKPRADIDVVPNRAASLRPRKETFLRTRDAVPAAAEKDLKESLLHHLSLVKDRVKAGESFPNPNAEEDTKQSLSEEPSQSKPLALGLPAYMTRSQKEKSAHKQSRTRSVISEDRSSDGYPDSEMIDILEDDSLVDVPQLPSHMPTSHEHTLISGNDSPVHEEFKTPPTTPPRLKENKFGLGINLRNNSNTSNEHTSAWSGHVSDFKPVGGKKRSSEDNEQMRPPPTRKVSRETKNDQVIGQYAAPTPPPENFHTLSRSSSSSRLNNSSSVSSSFTSASPAWTSPNTSFCASSLATSFDSSADETDTTIRPSLKQPPSKRPANNEAPWYRPQSAQTGATGKNSIAKHANGNGGSKLLDPHPNDQLTFNSIAFARNATNPSAAIESQLLNRLVSCSAFVPLFDQYPNIPFGQLFEVYRMSIACGVPLEMFRGCLTQKYEKYDLLWTDLTSTIADAKGSCIPERSSLAAWSRLNDYRGVAFMGKLQFLDQVTGPVFKLSLHPLKVESSYRFARKYGHDRFCVIQLPSLGNDGLPSYLKPIQAAASDIIIKWLVETEHCFLGRVWRAFYVKPESTKKGQKGSKNNFSDARYRVYLFAENGVDFRQTPIRGEADPRAISHCRVTVRQLLDWHMLPDINAEQTVLKFFNRLGLGLTSTAPTFEFLPQEIIRSHDACAENCEARRLDFDLSEQLKTGRVSEKPMGNVMNDGCARISRDAALAIANTRGLDQVPSVLQGRIGPAKGVWMVDVLDERPSHVARRDGTCPWIEITDSQLKYAPHPIDALMPDRDRLTFEVNKTSKKLSPSPLSFQLIPILEDRGVPPMVFERLLRDDLNDKLGDLELALDDSLALRKWNQDTSPVTHERAQYGGIEMGGALPESSSEQINWFVEHGFEPRSCLFLKDLLWKSIRSYCLRLESRMKIGLERSTSAFMIADPLGLLEEDQVHIGFSRGFRDKNLGFNEIMLHEIDILVARLPAHLPSDIQKVRAVFKPELRIYRDVIVFSSRGKASLASKLSGGDYDGDTAWICWEPDIVDPFTNADVPEAPAPEIYGIEKDKTKVSDLLLLEDYTGKFLQHSFRLNLQTSMLGICSNYHESLCYHNGNINSPQAIAIGILLGYLVDSAKGGFKFDETQWAAYRKQLGLTQYLEKPAYQDRKKSREKPDNLLDHLVFHVAREEREKILKSLNERLKNVSPWDEDLIRLYRRESEAARTDPVIDNVLKNLKKGLEDVFTYWKKNAKREDDDEGLPVSKKGAVASFRSVVEECRRQFVALKPVIDETCANQRSHTVDRWRCNDSEKRTDEWDLVKASVAFHHFHKSISFIWHIAGVELGELKATKEGRGTYSCTISRISDAMKVDSKLVDCFTREKAQLEAFGIAGDDDDDDFGSDIDMMDL